MWTSPVPPGDDPGEFHIITSNTGFSEWKSFLKNDRLTAALIDRLTESSYVINMKNCVSLRPKLNQEP